MKLSHYLFLSVAFIFATAFSTSEIKAQTSAPRTITVIGSATDKAAKASDSHSLTMRVTAHEATATLSFARLSDQIRALKKTLSDAGANAGDISEGEVQMTPSYDYSKAGLPPAITGYNVTKPVVVKVEREADVPKYIDLVTQAGISSVALGSAVAERVEGSDVDANLELSALNDAHERAEELAKQIGVKLGDVVSVSTVESQSSAGGGRGEEEERERGRPSQPQKKSLELRVTYGVH